VGNFSVVFNGMSSLNVGGIAGQANNVSIANCGVTGVIGGNSAAYLTVGGIVGNISSSSASGGDVSESSFTGTISGRTDTHSAEAGGIAGYIVDAEITACFAELLRIKAEADNPRVGGIAGTIAGGDINKSYATGIIESIASGSESNAGGIVGWLQGNSSIENCYAWTDVSASSVYNGGMSTNEENAGGIAGTNKDLPNTATISKCYAAGTVKASGQQNYIFVGGIVGNTDNTLISASMALVEELDGGPSTRARNVYAIGAVAGSGTFAGSGNYSRNDIVYKNATNTNFDYGPNARGGRQTPIAGFKSSAHYSATSPAWNFTAGTGDWKFLPAGSNYDYPVLAWQTAKPGTALEEASKGGFKVEIEWP
jgi:hypothetical protein